MARSHTRILQYPFATSLQGALLDSYHEDRSAGQWNIILDIRAFEQTASKLFERDGSVHERVQGSYVSAQLLFTGVSGLKGSEYFQTLTDIPAEDPTRIINDLLSWRQPEQQDIFFLLSMHQAESLMFFAGDVRYEILSQESVPFMLERDWCAPPSMPNRLVPKPRKLHQRFGGDPVTFHLDARSHHQRLFIGGVDIQPNERPKVDVVFNVGETPSKWAKDDRVYLQDRWDNKGEGSKGMSLDVIHEEANWVIEHLRKSRRVLVHCAAGMNRSSTLCCATLILLEGLTAEQALERVREHHPWARPDSGHWLKLRRLAEINARSR
jgi:dual specificity protein phosphatase-like protein